jgi:hypothetical protein
VRSTSYEAPHYAIFSTHLSLHPSKIYQNVIFFSNLSLRGPLRNGIYYTLFKIFFWNTAASYPMREKCERIILMAHRPPLSVELPGVADTTRHETPLCCNRH